MVQQGWYPDPWGHAALRWWDGQQWTSWTHELETHVMAPVSQVGDGTALDVGHGHSGSGLAALLGDADRIAVVDVETTGLYSTDRVVEVAVVTVDRSGSIVDEFDCLINPLRDPGPSWLHGLTPSALNGAPMFEDIALHLAASEPAAFRRSAVLLASSWPPDCRACLRIRPRADRRSHPLAVSPCTSPALGKWSIPRPHARHQPSGQRTIVKMRAFDIGISPNARMARSAFGMNLT